MTAAPLPSTATIVLDACCTVNLAATGRIGDILSSLPYSFRIAPLAPGESLWLDIPGAEDRELIELQPLIDDAVLIEEPLRGAEEQELFVTLAAFIDDGEAEAAALAGHRGWILATDDRKARRVAVEHFPALALVGTLDLIVQWQQTAAPTDEVVAGALRRIAERARYRPRRLHPLRSWWEAHVPEL